MILKYLECLIFNGTTRKDSCGSREEQMDGNKKLALRGRELIRNSLKKRSNEQ